LTLPSFRPPTDAIIAILSIPPSASLHRPFAATLIIQNRSPSRTADLVLQTESSEAFVVAGPRTSRLPTLLPGTSIDIRFNLVPLLCGTSCRLPAFKIYDRRKRSGPPATTASDEVVTLDPVQIVDEHSDARDEKGVDLPIHIRSPDDPQQLELRKQGLTMLVLPTI